LNEVPANADRRWKGVVRALLLGALLPLSILLLWHLASLRENTLVPSIGEVVRVLLHPLEEPRLDSRPLAHSVLVSALRVLAGFSAAVLFAVPVGIAVGRSKLCREIVSPLVEMTRPVCPVAWLPLLILVFGNASAASFLYGEDAWRHDILAQVPWAMVVVIWWGAFFPIFINTVHGVMHVRTLFIEVARTNGASEAQIFRHIVLPASLPAIVAGLRIGMGTAWMVIVAAEFYPGTRSGLAYMITTADEVGRFEYVFACILMIGLLGLLTNAALQRLENRIGRWQARER
jgi:NitT/TauT family transport system permease protein